MPTESEPFRSSRHPRDSGFRTNSHAGLAAGQGLLRGPCAGSVAPACPVRHTEIVCGADGADGMTAGAAAPSGVPPETCR